MGETGRAIRRIVLIAAMTAVLEVAKFALNAIANVELITLLVMLYTRKFGWKMSLASVLLFAVLESMWWGVSIWTVTYFYVWPLLVLLAYLMRRQMDRFKAAVLSCISRALRGRSFSSVASSLALTSGPAFSAWGWKFGMREARIRPASG